MAPRGGNKQQVTVLKQQINLGDEVEQHANKEIDLEIKRDMVDAADLFGRGRGTQVAKHPCR